MSELGIVSKIRPCRICGHGDWCAFLPDEPHKEICMRVSEGSYAQSEMGGGTGYFHDLGGGNDDWKTDKHHRKAQKRRSRAFDAPPGDCESFVKQAILNMTDDKLAGLARELGLTRRSLRAIGAGWATKFMLQAQDTRCPDDGMFTFPMQNHKGEVVGVRTRSKDNGKYSVKGWTSGLFLPVDFSCRGELLVICEGPTDLAALLCLGVNACGRPSNNGGGDIAKWLVAAHKPSEVFIIHDNDTPGSDAEASTIRGAETLAESLRSPNRTVRVMQPPYHKDMRQWVAAGCTKEDIEELGDNSDPITKKRYEWMAK